MTNRHLAFANPARHNSKIYHFGETRFGTRLSRDLDLASHFQWREPASGSDKHGTRDEKNHGILVRGLRWIKTKFNWLKQQKNGINQPKWCENTKNGIQPTLVVFHQPKWRFNQGISSTNTTWFKPRIWCDESSTTDFTKKNIRIFCHPKWWW